MFPQPFVKCCFLEIAGAKRDSKTNERFRVAGFHSLRQPSEKGAPFFVDPSELERALFLERRSEGFYRGRLRARIAGNQIDVVAEAERSLTIGLHRPVKRRERWIHHGAFFATKLFALGDPLFAR